MEIEEAIKTTHISSSSESFIASGQCVRDLINHLKLAVLLIYASLG